MKARYGLQLACVVLFSLCLHGQPCVQAFLQQCLLLVVLRKFVGHTNAKHWDEKACIQGKKFRVSRHGSSVLFGFSLSLLSTAFDGN